MKTIIFVHPIMSVDFIFAQARKLGYKIFTITTTLELEHLNHEFLQQHSDFIINGSSDAAQDINSIRQVISDHNLEAVAIINGIDSSLYYTDYLQKQLLGYPIDLEASKVRLNKYQVNVKLAQLKLKTIPSVEISSKKDLQTKQALIAELGLPTVAKPSEDTAAMAAFEIISDHDGLNAYLDKYLNQPNPYYYSKTIQKIILQQYISIKNFEEFVIDFTSFAGKHYCHGILHYDKELKENTYKISRYHTPYIVDEIPNIKKVLDYMSACLTALDVQYGFTHNELFWDKKDTFYLIESNNRILGNGCVEAYQDSYGCNPLEIYINLRNRQVIAKYPNTRKSYAKIMDLYNTSIPNASSLNVTDIASFKKIIHFRKKQKNAVDFYKQYTRVDNINAAVLLSNSSQEVLEQDIATILEREANGTLFIE
ncbi:hypothetical protein BH10PSE19_BH10PSE19_10690 [soil metagenome]